MLRDDALTGRTGHRQERCVLMSAKSKGFASKRRTHRRLRSEQREHWPARIDRRREPPLCQTSCRLDRIKTPGGAEGRTWHDTDRSSKTRR
jgi:hypothetical protein